MTTVHSLALLGNSPIPMASYLKALGTLRIVSQQGDQSARGWWDHETFLLESRFDEQGLVEFFLNDYAPTPIVAPWNGGSGFYPKDKKAAVAIKTILHGRAGRYAAYRETLRGCAKIVHRLGLLEKPDDLAKKYHLLLCCRNELPDSVIPWLDAAYVLSRDGAKHPPLLGTGGNEARLEFSKNYMECLLAIVPPDLSPASPLSPGQLREALFATIDCVRASGMIGQFDPGNRGGPNSGTGFEGPSTVNPWDYVMMLEGAVCFAAATVKQLDSANSGALAYPFCVRAAGVGYASSGGTDEANGRPEMWLPLWNTPALYPVVEQILQEGRVETGRRQARNGVDFARAIASLGVDRGIAEFERFGFHQRYGTDNYLSVPLGRFRVNANPLVEELLSPIDRWLDRFRRAATAKTAPARAGRALRRIDSAILNLCRRGSHQGVQALLIALGEAEAAVAISKSLREGDRGNGIPPVPLLAENWLFQAADGTREFRLAAALASVSHPSVGPFRQHLEPINPAGIHAARPFAAWAARAYSPSLVWSSADLVRNLLAVLSRRIIEAGMRGDQANAGEPTAPFDGCFPVSLGDIAAFIRGDVDDARIEGLLAGMILIDWNPRTCAGSNRRLFTELAGPSTPLPDAVYAILKLCHLPRPLDGEPIKFSPTITRRAISGDAPAATEAAVRRLRASGFPPAVGAIYCDAARIRRSAAALLFPISERSTRDLVNQVLARDLANDR